MIVIYAVILLGNSGAVTFHSSLLKCKKSEKLVTFDLKDNNLSNDGWTLVTRSDKYKSSPQRFISSEKNFVIEKLPYDPSVKSLTPITDTCPPPVVLANSSIFLENNSVPGIPINIFANNSSSSNISTGDTDSPMDKSGTTDDNSNNNDDASELSSIGSCDEDDNNNNSNGRPAVGLETGAPSIKSDFKIAFNQNIPIHRDGKGLENVKEMLKLLYR